MCFHLFSGNKLSCFSQLYVFFNKLANDFLFFVVFEFGGGNRPLVCLFLMTARLCGIMFCSGDSDLICLKSSLTSSIT